MRTKIQQENLLGDATSVAFCGTEVPAPYKPHGVLLHTLRGMLNIFNKARKKKGGRNGHAQSAPEGKKKLVTKTEGFFDRGVTGEIALAQITHEATALADKLEQTQT